MKVVVLFLLCLTALLLQAATANGVTCKGGRQCMECNKDGYCPGWMHFGKRNEDGGLRREQPGKRGTGIRCRGNVECYTQCDKDGYCPRSHWVHFGKREDGESKRESKYIRCRGNVECYTQCDKDGYCPRSQYVRFGKREDDESKRDSKYIRCRGNVECRTQCDKDGYCPRSQFVRFGKREDDESKMPNKRDVELRTWVSSS